MRHKTFLMTIILFCSCSNTSSKNKEASEVTSPPKSEAEVIESQFPPIGAQARINPTKAEEADDRETQYIKASFRQYADGKIHSADLVAAEAKRRFRRDELAAPFYRKYFDTVLEFEFDRVLICPTEVDYENLSAALKEKDQKSINQMEEAKRFGFLAYGTKVTVLAKHTALSKVRAVTGDEGWITSYALDQNMTAEDARKIPKKRPLDLRNSELNRVSAETK
jgi:hypothetical protein